MKTVLDYSHYVELIDQEEDCCRSGFPTDVWRPVDSHGVTNKGCWRFYHTWDAVMQSNAYFYERLRVFGDDRLYFEHCPYCKTSLHKPFYHHRTTQNSDFGEVCVRECPTCGWWEHSDQYELNIEGEHYRSREVRRHGLLREFSVGGSEVPVEALRKHVVNHPDSIYYISPSKMECLVADVWKDFMDCEAIHVGGPNDQGIDVILVDGDYRYAIQVKRRSSSTKAESVKTIREFIGAMILAGEVRGIALTTAPHFSHAALKAAASIADVSTIEQIDLVDGKRFVDVCKATAASHVRPWEQFTNDLRVVPIIKTSFFAIPMRMGLRS
jgi:hypothetical protein